MAVALKTALFFDCFREGPKQSRNSRDRNNVKQLKNKPEQSRNNHRNSHRNSRNNSLGEGETVSPLARNPYLPLPDRQRCALRGFACRPSASPSNRTSS
jgi:hypothetical protein